MNYKAISFSMLLSISPLARGADLTGLWTQLDDGKPSALIRIAERDNDRFEGIVERIFPEPGETSNPLCISCSGELHNRPILGMRIIHGIKRKTESHFGDGEILDPETGKTYRCSMDLAPDGNKLQVNGSIGPAWLGRTETWQRAE